MADTARLTGVAPMFLVDNVERTAEWYRDHLGFTIGDYFREHEHPHPAGEEPEGVVEFVILARDGQQLMLGRTVEPGLGVASNTDAKQFSSDAYFWLTGVKALHEAVQATDANFRQELELQPYGLWEFQVLDLDGRVITFGGEA